MKTLLIILGTLCVFGCTQRQDKKNYNKEPILTKNNSDVERVEKLKIKSVEEGSPEAYGNLVDYYYNHPSRYYELLPISIIMADRFDNDNARVSIYYQSLMLYNDGKSQDELFFSLPKKQQYFVLAYLQEGAENKNPGCMEILKRLKKIGLETED